MTQPLNGLVPPALPSKFLLSLKDVSVGKQKEFATFVHPDIPELDEVIVCLEKEESKGPLSFNFQSTFIAFKKKYMPNDQEDDGLV